MFATSLETELREIGRTRVNALPSIVAERVAALRYRLDRVNELRCDGYTTEETPDFVPGVPVEVKAVRLTHNGGLRLGRVGINYETHQQLLEAGGWYVVVLYVEVFHHGEDRILVLATDMMDAGVVDRYVQEGAGEYQKVRWDLLIDPELHDVDLERWEGDDA